MTKQEILDAIQEYITTNGLQEITGQVMNVILTAIANIIPDETMLTSSFGGVVTPATVITITPGAGRWFIAKAGTYTNYGNFTFTNDKLNILSYNGSTWEKHEIDLPHAEDFSETEFNKVAKNVGPSFVSLTSKDLTNVNFPNSVTSGQGTSMFTVKLDYDQNISKLKVKVATPGIGNFTARRGTSTISIKSNVALTVGWNEIFVDFDALANDYIGYSTLTSTSNLNYTDSGSGSYYTVNGSNAIVTWPGNIALEVYKKEYKGNLLNDLLNLKKLNTTEFNRLNKYSTPLLRQIDYGVVSVFNLPNIDDLMGNNKINISSSAISGIFEYNAYAWSLAFTVNMPSMYSANKNIATINLGSYSLVLNAGGSGIGGTIGSQSNGIAYDYANKKLKIEIIADAYFLNVIVDGQRIGFKNVGKKATQFNFSLNTQDNKTFDNIAFWNRDISVDRAIQWGIDQDPFVLKGIQDRMFPSTGYQISNHLLEDNPYFEIPAEQSIIKFKGKYFMYYTAAKSTPTTFIESGIGVAVSNRPDGGFMMYTNDAIIGGDRNKAGVTRAMSSGVYVIGDNVYVFAARDYTASNAGGNIFKSSDGLNFTLVGDFLPTGIPYLANISIYPEKQSNNYYYGIVEGKPGTTWASYLVRSLNIDSGWEVVQILPSLAVNSNGMYGGPELLKSANNDRWMLFYHSAYELNGNSPTAIFYAECTEIEPKNWVKKGKVLDINDELEFYDAYNVDQVATPQIYEENGKTYMSIVYAQNETTLHCQIRVFKLDMTKEELVGMIPIEI